MTSTFVNLQLNKSIPEPFYFKKPSRNSSQVITQEYHPDIKNKKLLFDLRVRSFNGNAIDLTKSSLLIKVRINSSAAAQRNAINETAGAWPNLSRTRSHWALINEMKISAKPNSHEYSGDNWGTQIEQEMNWNLMPTAQRWMYWNNAWLQKNGFHVHEKTNLMFRTGMILPTLSNAAHPVTFFPFSSSFPTGNTANVAGYDVFNDNTNKISQIVAKNWMTANAEKVLVYDLHMFFKNQKYLYPHFQPYIEISLHEDMSIYSNDRSKNQNIISSYEVIDARMLLYVTDTGEDVSQFLDKAFDKGMVINAPFHYNTKPPYPNFFNLDMFVTVDNAGIAPIVMLKGAPYAFYNATSKGQTAIKEQYVRYPQRIQRTPLANAKVSYNLTLENIFLQRRVQYLFRNQDAFDSWDDYMFWYFQKLRNSQFGGSFMKNSLFYSTVMNDELVTHKTLNSSYTGRKNSSNNAREITPFFSTVPENFPSGTGLMPSVEGGAIQVLRVSEEIEKVLPFKGIPYDVSVSQQYTYVWIIRNNELIIKTVSLNNEDIDNINSVGNSTSIFPVRNLSVILSVP